MQQFNFNFELIKDEILRKLAIELAEATNNFTKAGEIRTMLGEWEHVDEISKKRGQARLPDFVTVAINGAAGITPLIQPLLGGKTNFIIGGNLYRTLYLKAG